MGASIGSGYVSDAKSFFMSLPGYPVSDVTDDGLCEMSYAMGGDRLVLVLLADGSVSFRSTSEATHDARRGKLSRSEAVKAAGMFIARHSRGVRLTDTGTLRSVGDDAVLSDTQVFRIERDDL